MAIAAAKRTCDCAIRTNVSRRMHVSKKTVTFQEFPLFKGIAFCLLINGQFIHRIVRRQFRRWNIGIDPFSGCRLCVSRSTTTQAVKQ